jgi:hypothetical protein
MDQVQEQIEMSSSLAFTSDDRSLIVLALEMSVIRWTSDADWLTKVIPANTELIEGFREQARGALRLLTRLTGNPEAP